LIGTLRLVLDGVTVLPTDLLEALLVGRIEARTLPKDVSPVVNDEPSPVVNDEPEISELPPELYGLSTRELSVLYQLVDGLPNKEIARRLNIAEATVKVHVKAILRKARLRNRTQVAMLVSRRGRVITFKPAPEPVNGGRPTVDVSGFSLGSSKNS
jgi:two-component system nitrate/nitrite response regulator NarL